jgi:hypothetical protein
MGLQASAGVAGALVTGNIEIAGHHLVVICIEAYCGPEREGKRALSVVVVVVEVIGHAGIAGSAP